MRARTMSAGLGALLVLGLVAACSSEADGSPAPSGGAGDGLTIVASTNVWGDVAAQVAGDLAHVTSIIDTAAADPHSYEASARVQLELARADLVIVNGGGYDDFAAQMLGALDDAPPVIEAVDLLVTDAGTRDDELNEHVWYDLPTVRAVADEIASRLATIEPAEAGTFEANAAAFTDRVAGLEDRAAAIAAAAGGAGVAVTEPVPLYLVAAAGFTDRTPPEFSESIEEEVDVPPAVMHEMLDLVSSSGEVAFLVYNEQTTGPQTDQVLAAARDAGVPVVSVTETLPEGEDYVSWMASTLDAFEQALVEQAPR